MKILVILLLSVLPIFGSEKPIPQYLQEISVTIKAGDAEGSGVIFTRKDASSNNVNFVWTAAHVVSRLRTEREVISPDGNKRTIVEFKDAQVIKEIFEDGRRVGQLSMEAELIRYSNADSGEDLALLKLRKSNFVDVSAKFYLDTKIPEIGSELYHVGSLLGQMGAGSMTSGIYSQIGRLVGKTYYDQTTCAAFPGSSGGGIFLKDGKYVAMLVRGAGETFNLVVPVRRMIAWSRNSRVEWALNPEIPMPNDVDLKTLPVEDVGKDFKSKQP